MTRREQIDKSWREGQKAGQKARDWWEALADSGGAQLVEAAMEDITADMLIFRLARLLGTSGVPITKTTLHALMVGVFHLQGPAFQVGIMALAHEEVLDPHPDPIEVLEEIAAKTVKWRATDQAEGMTHPSYEATIALNALREINGEPHG